MDKINRDLPNNIWNREGFAMSGFGERSRLWGKIKHIKKCIYWSKQRIVRGYADIDKWNMSHFLQTLIPDMLQELRDNRWGSPGFLGEKLQTETEVEENRKRGGGGTVHFMNELPEYKEIYEKHYAEERKLEAYRIECKDEALNLLKEYFYSLWT